LSGVEGLLILICGPTASGKTGLASKLAGEYPLSLISADSMQVYRGMDIGTAKPGGAERDAFALIDVALPGEGFSAGRFADLAGKAARKAWSEGKIPCIVGGTGLYMQALIHGLAEIPAIPEDLRRAVSDMPLEDMRAEIQAGDPETAATLDLKNPRRLQRAIEVLRHTGRGLDSWRRRGNKGALAHSKRLWLGLNPPKEALEAAIQKRNRRALQSGWLEETAALREKYGAEALLSTGAIGYAELLDVLDKKIELKEAETLIETRTLQYARRQRTWFKREAEIQWLETADAKMASQRIRNAL
jgi:tRNA dimethylallyltransferase